MPYATYEDVVRYGGYDLTAEEQAQVDELCADASAWMKLYCGSDSLTGLVPDSNILRMLCAQLVSGLWDMRRKKREYGAAGSLGVGDFSISFERVAGEDPDIISKLDAIKQRVEMVGGVEVVEFDLGDV